ncbi:MAG: hypothetical protein SVX38_09040, partial [Chloroflexota bacterium]|nr:hypothetical protein [Chloroflexota bacterium]
MDSSNAPHKSVAEKQADELSYFARFTDLATYRNLGELLAEALSFVLHTLQASAGSLLFVHNVTHRVRQGNLEGAAMEQIDLWEKTVESKLAQARRQIYTPRMAPITLRRLPQTKQTLLNTPLLSHTSV